MAEDGAFEGEAARQGRRARGQQPKGRGGRGALDKCVTLTLSLYLSLSCSLSLSFSISLSFYIYLSVCLPGRGQRGGRRQQQPGQGGQRGRSSPDRPSASLHGARTTSSYR